MNRRKTNEGQLRPIINRMPTGRQIRRALREQRRAWGIRQTATMAMGRANIALAFVSRGFFGRLKWLLIGR